MTLKKRAFPGLTLVPEVLRRRSMVERTPISAATSADSSMLSVRSFEFTTDASVVSPKLGAGPRVSSEAVSVRGVMSPGVWGAGSVEPISWDKLYSMPLISANSRWKTTS